MSQLTSPDATKTKTRRMAMPREARRVGRKLLTQQCWCWGQDVKCPSGNLLMQYGFERQRPPQGESGATTYNLKLLPDARVALWGFGLWYGEEGQGAVFIGRFNFEVLWSEAWDLPHQVWIPPQIGEFARVPSTRTERVATRRLLSRALLWMQSYESWILETHGVEYRCRCLEKFSKALAPEIAVQSWKPLSQAVLSSRLPVRSSVSFEYSNGFSL